MTQLRRVRLLSIVLCLIGSSPAPAQNEDERLIRLPQARQQGWSAPSPLASTDERGAAPGFSVSHKTNSVASAFLQLQGKTSLVYQYLPSGMTATRWMFHQPLEKQALAKRDGLPVGESGLRIVCTLRSHEDLLFTVVLRSVSADEWRGAVLAPSASGQFDPVVLKEFIGTEDLAGIRSLEIRFIHGLLTILVNDRVASRYIANSLGSVFVETSISAGEGALELERATAAAVPMGSDFESAVAQFVSDRSVVFSIKGAFAANDLARVERIIDERNEQLRQSLDPARAGYFALCEFQAAGACAGLEKNNKAIQICEALDQVPEEILPTLHGERLRVREVHGGLLRLTGKLEKAEAVLRQIVSNYDVLYGNDHVQTVNARAGLAATLTDMGKGRAAEAILEDQLQLQGWRKHPQQRELHAMLLTNLQAARSAYGDEVGALDAGRQIIEVSLSGGPEEDARSEVDSANLILNHAAALEHAGRLVESEVLFRRYFGPQGESRLPFSQLLTTHSLNYASLLARLGETDRARVLMESTIRRIKDRGLTNLLEYPVALRNLAQLSTPERAVELNAEAVRVASEFSGPENAVLVDLRAALAKSFLFVGRFEDAEQEIEAALDLLNKLFPDGHPKSAFLHESAGVVQLERGNLAEGIASLQRAVEIAEHTYGSTSLQALSPCAMLPDALLLQGDVESAAAVCDTVLADLLSLSSAILPTRSEAAARQWILNEPRMPFLAIALAVGTDEAIRRAYRHHWHLNARVSRFRALRLTGGAEIESRHTRLLRDYAAIMMSDSRAPVAASDIEQARLTLQQFETEHCRDSEQSLVIRDAEPGDLANVLTPHVALVDFVKSVEPLYSGANHAEPHGPTRGSVRERYDAFILTVVPDHSIRIRAIPLGNAAEIDALARKLHASLADPEVSAIDSFRSASEFYRTVWKPLAPHVNEYGHIVVIPTGTLNLVPWNVLPVGESTDLLFDRHTISVTEFAQQLCLPVAGQPVEPERLVVVGDIDYRTEVTPKSVTPTIDWISSAGTEKELLSATSTGSGFDSPIVQLGAATRGGAFGEWDPLPASLDESETLLDLFETHRRGEAQFLRGNAATPRRVAQSFRGATSLHFAIHAFYLADDSEVELVIDPRRSSLIGSNGDSRNLYSTSTIAVQNPFLLSGLVLSPSRNGSGGTTGQIMTAEQIARMDLSGVRLVTLSACDTGRGEALNGEVAAGLRSAFHRAGVRCVVSSLWSVNDVTTSALMKEFYRNLWELNQSPATALRNAQKKLRDDLQAGRVVPLAWKTRGIDTNRKIVVNEKPVDWSSIAAWRHWAAFQVSGTP